MLTAQKLSEVNKLRKEFFLKRVGEKVADLNSNSSWSDIIEKSNLCISVFQDFLYDVRGDLCQSCMWPSEQEVRRFFRSLYGYEPLMNKLFARESDYYRGSSYHGCFSPRAHIYMVPRHTDEYLIFDVYIVSPQAARIYSGDWFLPFTSAAVCVSFVDELPEEIAAKF